jgi:hypothetical protein
MSRKAMLQQDASFSSLGVIIQAKTKRGVSEFFFDKKGLSHFASLPREYSAFLIAREER